MPSHEYKDARSNFSAELERVLDTKRRYAFARFHDGELALLRGEPYRARSGWSVDGPTWLSEPLAAALEYRDPRYVVGISPPCDLPQATAWYRKHTRGRKTSQDLTYATLFMHANYPAARAKLSALVDAGAVVVSCRGGNVTVPRGIRQPWDIDDIVARLVESKTPILLACGPAAAVIVHRYCLATDGSSRQPILDVGAALDQRLHGKATREYMRDASALRTHACSFDKGAWAPWAKPYKSPNSHDLRRDRMLAASRSARQRGKPG